MTEQLKFEVGKHYRTRTGEKLLCLWVFRNGSALFVNAAADTYGYRCCNGRVYSTDDASPHDIVGEWREPRQWTVYVVQVIDEMIGVTTEAGSRKILARVTVTEGEGLE